VLMLAYGATGVGLAPRGELSTVLVYRTIGAPGVTRWLVDGDDLVRDLEATRLTPAAPVDVFVGRPGGDLPERLAVMARELEAVSMMLRQVTWRTPPGLGQTSMHHNHRLCLIADKMMTSDIGHADLSWLGLIGPLTTGQGLRESHRMFMRDPGEITRRRLVASFRGTIKTREP